MEQLEFRQLNLNSEQELEQVLAMLQADWPERADGELESLMLSNKSFPVSFVLLSTISQSVIGHSRLTTLAGNKAGLFVENVVVDSNFRGKGYGKLLMILTKKESLKRGYSELYLATADQQSFYEHIGYNVCATGITPIRFSQNPDVSIILEKKFRYSKSPFVKSDPSGRCGNSDGLWQNSGNISEISKLGKISVHLTSEVSHQSNANISPKLSLSSERPSEQKWKNERTYSVKIIGSGEKRVFMHKKLL